MVRIATASVAIGMAVMIVTLAIVMGFKRDISDIPDGNEDISVSALSGEGIAELKSLMRDTALPQGALDEAFVIEERHFEALGRAVRSLSGAENAIGIFPADIISVDIKDAWDALGEITGATATEEIINTIFSKFCVGK